MTQTKKQMINAINVALKATQSFINEIQNDIKVLQNNGVTFKVKTVYGNAFEARMNQVKTKLERPIILSDLGINDLIKEKMIEKSLKDIQVFKNQMLHYYQKNKPKFN